MNRKYKFLLFAFLVLIYSCTQKSKTNELTKYSGNPVVQGWYADPEGIIFGNEYWIYPTFSDDYGEPDVSTEFTSKQIKLQKNTINPQYLKQTFINAFSSKDLVNWTKIKLV
jgi:hypothetical protein